MIEFAHNLSFRSRFTQIKLLQELGKGDGIVITWAKRKWSTHL
jgi:hypothetical protein